MLRKGFAFWKVPRLCSFVLLATATCRWRWVWSVGGMIMAGETVLVLLLSTQIPHRTTCDRTRAYVVWCRPQTGDPPAQLHSLRASCMSHYVQHMFGLNCQFLRKTSEVSFLKSRLSNQSTSSINVFQKMASYAHKMASYAHKMASYAHKMAVCKHIRGHHKPVWP